MAAVGADHADPTHDASVAPTSPSPPASAPVLASPNPETAAAAITEAGLARRLADIEALSQEAAGYRSLGSEGYDRALAHVRGELAAAGWRVGADPFAAHLFTPGVGSSLVVGTSAFGGSDLAPVPFAPGGTAEGPLAAVGWNPGPYRALGRRPSLVRP